MAYTIHGHVSKGYESVYAQFEKNFADGKEENAQLCAYVGEELVVDLWGSVSKSNTTPNFNADSLTNVFSSTKSLTAICMATLVDKTCMKYTDKIVTYWPEYGNGSEEKEDITISEILQHKGGMVNFSQTVRLVDIQRENIKNNSIGSIIENESLKFPPEKANTKTEYHGLTRGWILTEIFRRVDPAHRTIGEALQDEIAGKLDADCYIGLPFSKLPNASNLSSNTAANVVGKSMIPKFMGRKVEMSFVDIMKLMAFIAKTAEKAPVPPLEPMKNNFSFFDLISVFHLSVVRSGEIPSANGHCSARGLGKVAAMMANKGTFQGTQILSEEAWESLHKREEEGNAMYPFGLPTHFSQGGVNYFVPFDNSPFESIKNSSRNRNGYFGWMGFGGSVFQWCPEHKVGFAYVPTLMVWDDLNNAKGALLQKLVLDCAKEQTT